VKKAVTRIYWEGEFRVEAALPEGPRRGNSWG